MSYNIRLVQDHDIPSILAIYAPYIENTTISLEKEVPNLNVFKNRIHSILKENPWIVCTYNEKIVGYAYATEHRSRFAYQWTREVSVYIDNDHHGKNIGKALYLTLFDLLKLQGYTNLIAIVGGDNSGSHRFHEKLGFRLAGTFNNVAYKMNAYRQTKAYELFIQEQDFIPGKLMKMQKLLIHPLFEKILALHLEKL
jgi:phosphinothricin acetyltransferase